MDISYERLNELSNEHGNAFYLLDSEQFQRNYEKLTKEFSDIYPNFNIAYSYKTNYTPKLCKIVDELGGYAEVVSDMEMEIALHVGVKPEKIIWNGPIKNDSKVEWLLLSGGTVNVDSLEELLRLEMFSEQHKEKVLNIGVRCNFDVGDGVISRFGIDTESDDFDSAIKLFVKNNNMRLINLQCHFAKRSVEYWPARAKGMVEIAERVKNAIGYMPQRIDLGGGIFGNMPEVLKKQFNSLIPEYKEYANAAATIFAENFVDETPELLVEPGTALAGDSMRFVGRVESIKTVRGKTFITMLGSQKNISMTGVNPPIEVFSKNRDRVKCVDADIVGYTCIESDVLYKNFEGEIAIGDFVVFSNCGSYSIVMKPPFIMPNFPILDICGKEVELIKRREEFGDLFHTYTF